MNEVGSRCGVWVHERMSWGSRCVVYGRMSRGRCGVWVHVGG